MAYGTTRVHDEPDGDIKDGTTAGYTPLMRAAVLGRKDIVDVLLQHGSHPRVKLKRPAEEKERDTEKEGKDDEEGNEEVEKSTVGDTKKDDEQGMNAAELAKKYGHDEIAKEIEAHF
jgi:ankyrin repeat protein